MLRSLSILASIREKLVLTSLILKRYFLKIFFFHCSQNITTLDKAEQLYNILSIQKEVGLMLPDWTEKVYPAKLLALAERNLAVLTETDYMKRIKGGKINFNY